MLISIKHQFIFIHIHKTAGTSIESALEKYLSPFELAFSRSISKHIKARELKEGLEKFYQRFHLKQQSFDNYFKFTFVRNSWDHQVSLYHHILRNPTHFQHSAVKCCQNFDQYINWVINESFHPLQKDFVIDKSGNLIVDFVGRFENIKTDFETICHKLQFNAELPHLNRNPKALKTYANYYNCDTIQMIYEYFKEDINLFNYSFPEITDISLK